MSWAGSAHLLLQQAGLAIVESDSNGRVKELNQRAERLLGLPRNEIIGVHLWEFLKGKKAAYRLILEQLEKNPAGISDVQVQLVGERIRSLWVEICVNPVTLNGDTGFLIFLKDVTRRKTSEDHAQETTNILLNILDDSADGILGITLDNRVFLWNRGAADIYGYATEEMLGQSLDRVIPEDLKAANELELFREEALKKGYIRDYVTDRVRKDGKRITVNITRTVIRDASGQIVGFSAIVRDITEQIHLQQQLIHSERLSVVGRMAAQVAHEIRNPLSSIMLNLEMVSDELDELTGGAVDEIRRMIQTIETEVNHLSNLTDDYLSFVRMPELKRTLTPPYEVLQEVLDIMDAQIEAAGIRVDLMLREVPMALMDRNQLRRAIMNTLKNAVEASNPGDTIRMWCSVSRDGNQLLIHVRDFGQGMSETVQRKLFDLFYTTKLTGSGLGMHITRQILREHGGEVDVFSKPGRGTLVRLKLPLGEASC